jgi:hypothetical protein
MGWSTVNFVPSSYENGPPPVLPSCVGRPVLTGCRASGKREHGHAAVVNDQEYGCARAVPSAAVAAVVTVAV